MSFLADLKEAVSYEPQRKVALVLVLTVAFVGGLGLVYFLRIKTASHTPPPASPEVIQTKAPEKASFSLDPAKKTIVVGETFSVNLVLDTGDNQVEAADAVLSFDLEVFEVVEVKAGELFTTPLINKVEGNLIKVSGGFGEMEGGKPKVPVRGVGRMAKITLRALKASSSSKLEFDLEKTIIASAGENIWPAKATVAGEYTVQSE